MFSDGDNLRLNFAATQDDGSDKSLSIETDLAKDIEERMDESGGAGNQNEQSNAVEEEVENGSRRRGRK
ncbi:hypothetical protein PVAND_016336 [Polypedilum vanderplanki]|uniref:Uncharacterized protein n=1 Tax=Polypedilum vanderplanki TaxID=319348 RepID=A0A9J6BEV6_POLVA|nr:hypothetical protein PVAND_016336 [Polypedilum vanderplanki]